MTVVWLTCLCSLVHVCGRRGRFSDSPFYNDVVYERYLMYIKQNYAIHKAIIATF